MQRTSSQRPLKGNQIIEQNGKHALLIPFDQEPTDAELYPEVDLLLKARMSEPAFEPTPENWEELHGG